MSRIIAIFTLKTAKLKSMIEIIEVRNYTPEHMKIVQQFLDQLTSQPMVLTEAAFKKLLADANSYLFFLLKDNEIAGMLTVGIYHSPTGSKAWIEDVVIDNSFRGQGLSKPFLNYAIEFVKQQDIPLLMLTSNPKRIAANRLYQSLGFEQKETNVYRMKF